MFKIKNYVFLITLYLFTGQVYAVPFNGTVFLENQNFGAVSGDISVPDKIMTVDSFPFLGLIFITNNVEILNPGFHTRATGDVNVPPGHVGAYMETEWNNNVTFIYMVWSVDSLGRYSIIDSDNDGNPGHALTNGVFLGGTFYYEFTAEPLGPPKPGVFLSINADGGNVQECTANSYSDVTINAVLTLVGGAELDSISWTVDGVFVGTGLSIIENLPLGTSFIEATALTTTGETGDNSLSVTVRDSIGPIVNVAVVDEDGVEVISSREGEYNVSINVTDACDPNPVITSSTATPTTVVTDGSLLKIDREKGIRLPVTAVRITVTAKDATGNFSQTTSQSSKTFNLE